MIRLPGALAALLLALPVSAGAQFTTFTAPPPKVQRAAAETAAARAQARTDSIQRVVLTDMKAWVDSAAGALAIAPPDSGVAQVATPARDSTAAPRADSVIGPAGAPRRADGATTFRDGAPAPDTATPIPTAALAGVILLGAGLLLRRRA